MKSISMARMCSTTAAFVLFAGCFLPAEASITSADYDLTSINLAGYSGIFQKLNVSLDNSTHIATFTFVSQNDGTNTYLMGDGGTVAVNLNGGFTFGSVTSTTFLPGFSGWTLDTTTSGNENGWGSFDLKLNDHGGAAEALAAISFTVTGTSLWDQASHVLEGNTQGAFAAAHVFVCTDPCDGNSKVVATGFTATGDGRTPPIEVPEPSTLLLGGLGLLGLAGLRMRQRS